MREIVVISGKGGTGKTSIAAALASFFQGECVVADCDVDAADMHLLLAPTVEYTEAFYSGQEARIEPLFCRYCGKCVTHCHFDAITYQEGVYTVDPIACEGCGYCAKICSTHAIEMLPKCAGEWYRSKTRMGDLMVHARLGVGAENSGKLVAKVKKEAKALAKEAHKAWMIVDGSPGIGCPVVSSLSGANYALLVTEPTVSGVHDFKRVYEVVKRFGIQAGCIINKADLNQAYSDALQEYCQEEGIAHIVSLPYSHTVPQAMIAQKSLLEYEDTLFQNLLKEGFERLKNMIEEKK